jgi:hypothetical protein
MNKKEKKKTMTKTWMLEPKNFSMNKKKKTMKTSSMNKKKEKKKTMTKT